MGFVSTPSGWLELVLEKDPHKSEHPVREQSNETPQRDRRLRVSLKHASSVFAGDVRLLPTRPDPKCRPPPPPVQVQTYAWWYIYIYFFFLFMYPASPHITQYIPYYHVSYGYGISLYIKSCRICNINRTKHWVGFGLYADKSSGQVFLIQVHRPSQNFSGDSIVYCITV